MKNLKEYLLESIIYHCGIELNEDYGEFKENHAVSSCISNKINTLYKKGIKEKEFSIYPKDVDEDVYFDELNIYYKVSNKYNYGYVYVSDVKTDIYIEVPEDFKLGELRKGIAHEFQHYLEDMIIIGNGLRSFEDIFDQDSEYGMLYNIARNFNDTRIPISSRNIRRALYILDSFEKHAFIAAICEEINQLKDKNRDLDKKLTPSEMFNIIKNTNEYKSFIELIDIFNQYKENGLSDKEEKILISEWNKLTNKKEFNIETIFNSLISKLKKAIKKMNNILPKKIAEELKVKYIN